MSFYILQISDGSHKGIAIKESILNASSASQSLAASKEGSMRDDRDSLAEMEEMVEGEGEGFRSVLTVSTKTRHDSRSFACLASNVYGNDTKKFNLIVQGGKRWIMDDL